MFFAKKAVGDTVDLEHARVHASLRAEYWFSTGSVFSNMVSVVPVVYFVCFAKS